MKRTVYEIWHKKSYLMSFDRRNKAEKKMRELLGTYKDKYDPEDFGLWRITREKMRVKR